MDRKIIKEEIKYSGVRFSVVQRTYETENGEKYIRDIVTPSNAAIILPIDEDGNIIFIKQYREVVGEELLELPAGVVEEGEDPKEAALREMEEETGMKAKEIELLTEVYPSCGYTNEKMYIYLAKNFKKGKMHLDADEHISGMVKLSIKEALEYLDKGMFKEGNIYTALLMYKHKYL